jgi:myo-inositol-1(or 4)-monophosphatase
MDDDLLAEVLDETADAVRAALGDLDDWGLAGTRAGQYRSDLAADAAALEVLGRARLGVLSEESGRHRPDAAVTVVVDPLDGSTNASRRIPWYATSLCAVDADGPQAALVVNLADGTRYAARRGGGATRDGRPIRPSGVARMRDALVGLSGFPPRWLGWRQYRALGAAALDLCAVAEGLTDGYLDASWNAHGPARRSSMPSAATWWCSTTTPAARRWRRPRRRCSTSWWPPGRRSPRRADPARLPWWLVHSAALPSVGARSLGPCSTASTEGASASTAACPGGCDGCSCAPSRRTTRSGRSV